MKTKLFGHVQRSQPKNQHQLYIPEDGIAVTYVQRGDWAVSRPSGAHCPGPEVCCRLKPAMGQDPGRTGCEIGLWLWSCETECYPDFRTGPDLTPCQKCRGRTAAHEFVENAPPSFANIQSLRVRTDSVNNAAACLSCCLDLDMRSRCCFAFSLTSGLGCSSFRPSGHETRNKRSLSDFPFNFLYQFR
jgi:hypothetical protein